jgi:hypothetical protein
MIRILFALAVLAALTGSWSNAMNAQKQQAVLVLLEDRLAFPLRDSIEQYKSDLEKEGYQVIVYENINAIASPSEIKAVLQGEYKNNENLTGAILIGKLTAPLYNEKGRQGDPYWHDHLSDFYYMDFDGIWEDSNNNGVYDDHMEFPMYYVDRIIKRINRIFHVWRSRRVPEIWVSRLRADTLSSLGDEVTLFKDYFSKNHSYRAGKMPLPPRRAFVVAAGVEVLKSDWGVRPMKLYSDVAVFQCQNNSSAVLREFLSSRDGYEWGIINVFSGPRIHHFDYYEGGGFDSSWWRTKEGRALITKYSDEIHNPPDVTWLDVQNMKPKILFYNLLTSEVGRHDQIDYLAGAYIFTGWGLTAVAGTQHSGAVGSPILYESLAAGKTMGEAWKDALVWSIEHSGEKKTIHWCDRETTRIEGSVAYKAVLIGDGTLRLPR